MCTPVCLAGHGVIVLRVLKRLLSELPAGHALVICGSHRHDTSERVFFECKVRVRDEEIRRAPSFSAKVMPRSESFIRLLKNSDTCEPVVLRSNQAPKLRNSIIC